MCLISSTANRRLPRTETEERRWRSRLTLARLRRRYLRNPRPASSASVSRPLEMARAVRVLSNALLPRTPTPRPCFFAGWLMQVVGWALSDLQTQLQVA